MRRVLVVGACAVAAAGVSIPAIAAWTVTTAPGSTGRSAATSLQPAAGVLAAPKTGATASAITVSWSAPSTGPAPTGYVVKRTAPTTATVCTVTVPATLSCDDTGLSAGTSYSYTVTSVRAGWNGVAQTATSTTVSADTTPPVTTATASGTLGENGFYTTNVTVALAATDSGTSATGVKEIVHSASGATVIGSTRTTGSSASAAFTAEGTSTLSFAASDNRGNVETTKTLEIKIDKTNPQNVAITNSPSGRTPTFIGTAGTDVNDVKSVTVTSTCTARNGNPPQVQTLTFTTTVTALGSWTVTAANNEIQNNSNCSATVTQRDQSGRSTTSTPAKTWAT